MAIRSWESRTYGMALLRLKGLLSRQERPTGVIPVRASFLGVFFVNVYNDNRWRVIAFKVTRFDSVVEANSYRGSR